jgi:hypothetical protein
MEQFYRKSTRQKIVFRIYLNQFNLSQLHFTFSRINTYNTTFNSIT